MKENILNIAGYYFIALENLSELKEELVKKTKSLGIKGTILLSPEGINLFLAGEPQNIRTFLSTYASTPWLSQMEIKESYSATIPFTRMLVRLKKEIIAFGDEHGVNPLVDKAPYIEPKELKKWYQEGKDFILLDTRNDYEIEVGTFHKAKHLNIKTFRAFPDAVQAQLDPSDETPIVAVCTGGVRCEKAAPYLLKQGFKNVYHLHGGFLKYFEDCGKSFYDGDCFVFDKRVAVDPNLAEAPLEQCFRCRHPLNQSDLAHPSYRINEQCPYCAQARCDTASVQAAPEASTPTAEKFVP